MDYPVNEYTEAVVLPLESRVGELHLSESKTRLLHAVLGKLTELGELADQLKKHWFYKSELDEVNLIEELGDDAFYTHLAMDTLGTTLGEVLDKNHRKLWKRYPEKFSKDRALNRDLAAERKELEN